MTTSIFPVLIGGERFEPAQQVPSNLRWLSALEQQHRQHTSFCLCTAGVQLPLVIRLYGRTSESRHYGLAKVRDTGLNHDPDCRFFGEAEDAGGEHDTLPAFEVRDDGTTRAHLAFSLQLTEPVEPSGQPARPGRASGSSRARASEAATLFRLWRASGLNVYRGHERTWYKVAYAILKSAEKIVISRKGETLADYLLIASGPQDRLMSAHNQRVLTNAANNPSRLIVIGRMRSVDTNGGKKLLPVHDFATLPKALISSITIDNLLKRRPLVRNLLEQRTGHVVLMACIEPEKNPWWKVLTMAVIPTSPNFVPAESSYEIEFENYLVEQGRHFIKPIIVDELGEGEQRPDYVLLDTVPRVRCEVWGMQTPEYLAGKAQRLADYEKRGQHLVSWSADPREPFPVLPPAIYKK